jgi:hypothetical protein
MRKIVAQLITGLTLAGSTLASQFQPRPPNANVPGAAYFMQADQQLVKNSRANVLPQVQQGWAAVQAAGPAAPGFVRGVATAVRLFRTVGRDLDAESVYDQAILSCNKPEFANKRKNLRYMLVQDLLASREYVKAEAILKAAVADEESSSKRSQLYTAFLQNLAFVREQEGEVDDAERILRSTIGLAAPELKDVVFANVMIFGSTPFPMTGDPNEALASFYQRHAQLDEAERMWRDQVTRTEGDKFQHLVAMRRLAGFLSAYRSSPEAFDLQKQILSQVEADHGSPYDVISEETTLAQYESAAGQAEQAKQLLENNLLQAEIASGRGSPEYQMALNQLFWNRNSTGDYDAAEKLARQQLENAEQGDHPDHNSMSSALSQLAQVKRSQGRTQEADELQKRMLEETLLAYPGRGAELQQRFDVLQKMIQQDMPGGQALVEVQNIVSSYFPFDAGELTRFQMVAQSLLAQQHKPEGVQVADIVSSLQQREGLDSDPGFVFSMVNWAAFYAYQLEDRARGRVILENARNLVLECCGENSSKMESVLREEAMINQNHAAVMAGLKRMRDFQVSVFGANNQNVETTTVQMARSASDAEDWERAKELYRGALKINAHRTGRRGGEYVRLLDTVSMEFFSHHDYQTALALNQHALEACNGFVWADQTRNSLEQNHRQIAEAIAEAIAGEKRNVGVRSSAQ